MSLRDAQAMPCWELPHHADEADFRDYFPHFSTREMALEDRADDLRQLKGDYDDPDDLRDARRQLMKSMPTQRSRVCVYLVCDGCDGELDHESDVVESGRSGLHIDPDDITPTFLADYSWTGTREGRHRCPTCGPEPMSAEDQARTPGPNDLPLFTIPRSTS